MYVKTYEPCVCCSGISDAGRPVFVVVQHWIWSDRKLAHLGFWAFTPVAYAVFDIMKVPMLRMIGNSSSWRSNATSEVAIRTPGEKYPAIHMH